MPNAINERQNAIIDFLDLKKVATIASILEEIKSSFGAITKITINRDIDKLIKLSLITKKGKARATHYELSPQYNLIKPIDQVAYFKVVPDKREVKVRFNFDVFDVLEKAMGSFELEELEKLNDKYLFNLKKLSKDILKQEFERLTIDLSWKSSQIEGNTYSLLETESLIKMHREAEGHTKAEATMILNHKEALDYIKEYSGDFKKLSIAKIEHLHSLLIQGLGVSKNLRNLPVGITGTKYRPLDNPHQIREAVEKTCEIINKIKNPFLKSIVLSALIAYIQPFTDGNKRTSRMMGNAVLMAHKICPLSYRSADEVEYKKAVILFYEQNNIYYFKELFKEQFEFAVNNYFLS